MLIIKNGIVINAEKGFEKKDILIDGEKIVVIGCELCDNSAEIINAEGCYVVPGFIDIHTHGAFGVDTVTASGRDLDKLSLFHASKGVTGFLPTTITLPVVKIVETLENLSAAIETGTSGARILGINLEGPFINRKFKGAHPEEYIMYPTIDLMEVFIRKSNHNIRIVTFAPELDGAMELVESFKGRNIVFAIGHSALNASGALQIFDQGIRHVSHLFNAMVGIHHREPGLAGVALDDDRVTVELIADGIHVNPLIIKMAVKCKSPAGVALITDSTMAAGLDDGEYFLGEQRVTVRNKEARLSSGILSGSTLTMIDAVRNMIKEFGIPLEQAVRMASETPSRIIGVNDRKGSITAGKDADILLLDKDLNVKMTMVEGRIVFRN